MRTAPFMVLAAMAVHATSWADVTIFENREAWETSAGDFTTIGFTEYPTGTFLDEHYAHLGVHFVSVSLDVVLNTGSFEAWPRDGAGIDGNSDVHLIFDQPITHFAIDHPGGFFVDFYASGQLIYEGFSGGSGTGF